jgi:ankyrin repeat protein
MYNQPSGSHEVMGPRTEAPKVPLALRDRQVTPLHEAANTGNLALLKKLIAKRAYPIDIDDGEGRSPLMHAVHRERLDCVAYLLSKGANINLGADDGATPLHEACYNSTLAIVQLLLREGASPVSTDQDGRQPVHWATDNSRNEKPMCVLIDHHGVDVNCVDETGMTPLMWAACHDNPPMVSALIDRGAEMLEKDIDGKTAMDWAVRPDSIAVLAMIVDEASTYFKDRVGRTVMHTAAERGSVLAIEHILSIRPDAIEDEDKMFRSPLFWAAACDEIAAARVLLLKGADVHKEDCSGLTAIDYATAKEYDRMAEVLVVHRLNLEQLGMTQLRGGTGVSPTAGSRGSPGGSGQRAKNRGGGATQRLSSGSPQRSNAVAAALQRGGVMSPESRSSGGSNLKRSDSVTSLYATPAALGFAPEGGNDAGNVGGGGGGLALENGAGLDVPTAVAGIAKRYTNNVGGLPVVPFSRSARMSDRECFEAALHPRGHSLGKIGSNGLGKQVNRFFRIAIDKGKAYLVWSKTQGDLAEFRAVMTAGLTGAPPDMPAADPCRLVVHTTVKSLHIVTADEVHRDGWNRALRYLVEGEQ